MNAWEGLLEALPWLAGSTAVIAAGTSLVSVLVGYFALRKERDTLRKADTAAAIASDDLATLGYHLYERLGSATVRGYLSDDEVRADITQALSAVRRYLGAPDGPTENEDSSVVTSPQTTERRASLPIWALTEDTWTQLARGRRDLELALGSALGIAPDERRRPAGQLVALAHERAILTKEEEENLRRAVNVADRAVHGVKVDPNAALESLVAMAEVSERVGRAPTNMTRPGKQKPVSTTRYVVPGEDGWEVRADGAQRASSVAATQREAINRARDIVYKNGGGEVVIQGRDGRIRARDTVSRGNDPR